MEDKVYVERRRLDGVAIERVGPFAAGSLELRTAVAAHMHIAMLHNRSRYPDDPSCQRVHELKPPYPFCRTPDKCAGQGYCKRDPACDD